MMQNPFAKKIPIGAARGVTLMHSGTDGAAGSQGEEDEANHTINDENVTGSNTFEGLPKTFSIVSDQGRSLVRCSTKNMDKSGLQNK